MFTYFLLQWRHNGREGVSNHRRIDRLLNSLFRRRSKKTSKLRVTGLREGNSPVTDDFPSQRASNAENISIWWRHYAVLVCRLLIQIPGKLISLVCHIIPLSSLFIIALNRFIRAMKRVFYDWAYCLNYLWPIYCPIRPQLVQLFYWSKWHI